MADALVSFMLQKLEKVYEDNFLPEVALVVGVEEEVKKLTTTFKVIQAVLNDAELKQIKKEAVKLWLEEFKDIAYDMDDVLDEWSYELHKSQNDTGEGNNNKKVTISYFSSLFSCFSEVVLRHNIGTKIKDIKERLDLVESKKHNYDFVEMKSDKKLTTRLQSSSQIHVSDVLGRDTDKETIMNKLMFCSESSTSTNHPETSSVQALHTPNIISIVGMGGLGKTTLAQLVFCEDQVQKHFDITMWVCVSNPFDLVNVTKSIIEEAKCEVPQSCGWNSLHQSLTKSIKGKRFLLVLDDVWTDDQSNWEPLMVSFRCGAEGSQILVTTRNERVALMMNATYTHSLEGLSDKDCSSLLNCRALSGKNAKNLEELKEIGEEISKKCKGLPLAAKTLGGLLYFKNDKKEWLGILEKDIWKLEAEVEKDFLMPALLLSYYDLPLPLRGCFVYCSIFPKDYYIKKDLLVKLWMAQGFLNKSRSEDDDLEGIGDEYFNNLAMRSFFQDFSKDKNGNITKCKMHDLVHDLAQYLTMNEYFVKHSNGTQFLDSSSRVRHLTIVCENRVGHSTDSFDHITSSVYNANKLRTLQILNGYQLGIKEAPVDLFHRFRCLKVLCLNNIGLENLSGEIENLIHLRYLDLSYNNKLKVLPETISNLYNLQTLKLHDCKSLCQLPREMWRLIKLRHLDTSGFNKLSYIPQGIGKLTSLRTLSEFIVGGASEGCKISELKNLNFLQGELRIKGLGTMETVNEAVEMVLKQKKLHSLMLNFKPNEENLQIMKGVLEVLEPHMGVLEVLEPHPYVVELRVFDYLGFKLSRWMESTSILSHVKTLELYNCINLIEFPAFGQLPSLEVLDIKGSIKVKNIGSEFYSNSSTLDMVPFPKLKELRMEEMKNLEVWELQHGVVMPCLRLIEVQDCPKLAALPALGKLPSLEVLTIRRADELTHIGGEFLYEVDEEAGGGERFNNNYTAFPKLDKLTIMGSEELEWEFGGSIAGGSGGKEIIIMPCLRELEIGGFRNSKPFVEILSKISTLEILEIHGEATEFIKYIGHDDDEIILFPNLENLWLSGMWDMEELKIGLQDMPILSWLTVSKCNKLKTIQWGGILSKLESFEIVECKSLCELGIPNLKSLHIGSPMHPSLPKAFATTLQALEELIIDCGDNTLTCMPEQIQQLTSLETLRLYGCGDKLEERCRKDEGEDWRIISHIPNILIINKQVDHKL